MLDADTFLITLYVEVDEFCKRRTLPPRPGPTPDLWPAEALTLALFSRWSTFRSERSFFRYAQRRLRGYFPRLPHRSQFNRQMRALSEEVTAFFLFSAERLERLTEPILQGQVGYGKTTCPRRAVGDRSTASPA